MIPPIRSKLVKLASFKQKKLHPLMESLPTDLLLEIFSRLPCKDIVVCKCVCRAWYTLLCHPNFSRHNRPFTSIFLFKHRCYDDTSYAFFLEIAGDGRLIKTPLPTNIPDFHLSPLVSPTEIRDSYIIGSCNGLLFFYQSRMGLDKSAFDNPDVFQRVYCYHPFSGECVPLAARRWSRDPVHYTVGCVPSTGHIKLLAFVNDRTQPARILTVGIDRRWRRLEDRLDHFNVHGVSFNGVYHWIDGDKYPKWLKTFDLGEEKTGSEWELPGELAQGTFALRLVALKNRISVIENLATFDLAIWTMEEYGVAESWFRKTVIGDFVVHHLGAILANGDILFSNDNGDGFTVVNLEKEDTTIEVYNCTTASGILYVAEFAPKFCSLENIIQNI